MSELSEFVKNTLSSLRQQRDELAVQMHLGKEEAKDEWEKVQAKLDQLSKDYEPFREAMEESAENVTESLKLVAGEIMSSFSRIRKSLD